MDENLILKSGDFSYKYHFSRFTFYAFIHYLPINQISKMLYITPMKSLRYIIVNLILFSFLLSIIGCGLKNDELIDAYNEFAIQSAKANLWNEAALRWEQIIEIDPNNAKAHNNLGVAYEALERFEDALKEYKKAVKLEPENKIYRRNLSRYKKIHNGG